MNFSTKLNNEEKLEMVEKVLGRFDKDSLDYIENFLHIKTKDQRVVPLELNAAQKIIYKTINELKKKNKPIRIVVLKARQEGVSTLCEALIFEKTARYPNVNSLIVAHEPESTEEIFAMSKRFYDMLPKWLQPMRRYDNKRQMAFENPDEKQRGKIAGRRSRMIIATADKIKIGRGLTLHCFHGSEVAFWKKAKELMISVMQAIPDHSDTMIFLESTANGMGGDGEYFYNLVQNAMAYKNDFQLIFLPWHLMPEYALNFSIEGEKESFIKSLDDYERDIKARFNLSLEQLNWRRWAIKNKCGGDIEKFKQEYPITVDESFIASSNTVIPKEVIEKQRKFIRDPIRTWEDVLIYEDLKWNHYYSLGADPAEGVGRDDSAFTVMDRMTGREIAHFSSNNIQPDLFAKKIVKVAEYYNNAMVVAEINGHGIAVIHELMRLGYPNIVHQKYFDHTLNEWTSRLGWKTTKVSKPLMVDEFIRGLREEEIGLSSTIIMSQMMTFVHTDEAEKHSMGAESGQKDDSLISAMLAWQGFKDLPGEFRFDPTENW